MKLKNKKTGKIVTAETYRCGGNCSIELVFAEENQPPCEYNSLAELCEEWEDYEEQKKNWYIGDYGDVFCESSENEWFYRKEIGNYFETKAEAEKAVKKLKAWKRLKDKGFRFINHSSSADGVHTIEYTFDGDIPVEPFDLLFGGEE